MKEITCVVFFAVLCLAAFAQQKKDGYTDTPFLPDGKWRVHDLNRPNPAVVAPAAASAPGGPPSDAVVLFDGRNLDRWQMQDGKPAAWKVENGYIEIVPHTGSLVTRDKFGDAQVHVEWLIPAGTPGAGQGRGNSGVMLMGRYELQVLDSNEGLTYADGQAAAMYGQYPPLVNACRKQGEWQTYDIVFEAPRFEGQQVVRPAYVTLFHNGVLMHHRQAFIGQVAHKLLARYQPHEAAGPLLLQDHSNPIRFRNIWIRRINLLQ